MIEWASNFNKAVICIICIRGVCDTISANSVHFPFELFLGNIRKVAPKYVTSFCFFYVVCRKKYWEMTRNIQFYNSCFKFDCGNRVEENMTYSCCSIHCNIYRIFMIGIMLWLNIMLRKFCKSSFWNQASSVWNKQSLLPPSLKCHLLIAF